MLPQTKSIPVQTYKGTNPYKPHSGIKATFVWRNQVNDGYKVSDNFKDEPMDLSNFLLVRTREYLLLQNKVFAPNNVMKTGKHNSLTKNISVQSLKLCRKELNDALESLDRLLYVSVGMQNLPVAFASNTLYVMERNGSGDRKYYESVLLPVLKEKIDYLHAEGVAQTIWALSNAEIYDKELWTKLAKLVEEKDFEAIFVKNERWTTSEYKTMSGNEHFFESELNDFSNKLFFQGKFHL